MESNVSSLDIIKYYDQCEIDYKWLWHLNNQSAMHYGYWHPDTRLLREALDNLNEYVLEKLDVTPGQRILDAGCGVGGTSLYLAKRLNVSVSGITLSEKQVQNANRRAEQFELMGNANFSVQDYCHTSFKEDSFDKVYGIESICHASEKLDFLKEAYRVTKSGGHLVVSDFFEADNLTAKEDKLLMKKWADSWAIPAFEPLSSFIAKANEAGFTLVEKNDISSYIMKSAKRLYIMFYPGIAVHTVFRILGLRNDIQGKNVWSTYYQYKSLKRNLWQYNVLKFIKK
jgi:tocopherol O-methyltransferase